MHCNATAVLENNSIYKQSKGCHCQVYIKECKKSDAESQKCSMLSNSDKDDGYFEV